MFNLTFVEDMLWILSNTTHPNNEHTQFCKELILHYRIEDWNDNVMTTLTIINLLFVGERIT